MKIKTTILAFLITLLITSCNDRVYDNIFDPNGGITCQVPI